ncbi:putative interferon-induced protein with tetratricopeptide repeats 1-like isoform X3 [Apostichopus japonicus]|uniref:Putative interferon-induced protein with tetratricopeptide repeats 1-like isoform X3 n=1 Tax=Stichopus japonicus TaxID=307972 RepID=A0A2G8L854_STIJA|nr:putative interferon-induced protein with tetratricopeptide repeats 1-like isoform X3 [Apostichopus japonicus]
MDSDWWKQVPCHFNWQLEKDCTVDYKTIVNKLDSKLETRDEVGWRDSVCDLLLFRGYIEVFPKFKEVNLNPVKAREFFLQAEEEARELDDNQERQACLTVSSANRLWLLENFRQSGSAAPNDEREMLLKTLTENWLAKPTAQSEELHAYIYVIEGFALARLGLTRCQEALQRYKRATEVIQSKASWYHTCGGLVGRFARKGEKSNADRYDEMDEEIKYYEKAIELDPTNDAARCDMALVLRKIPERSNEARRLIEEASDESCQVILVKARFYRWQNELQKALDVLQKGEELKTPRSDIFFQKSLIYSQLAKQSNNNDDKYRYLRDEMSNIDKCLAKEPGHFYAFVYKAWAHHKLREYDRAEATYLEAIERFKSSLQDHLQAQHWYVQHLVKSNSGRRVTEKAASICEEIFHSCVKILKERPGELENRITGKWDT